MLLNAEQRSLISVIFRQDFEDGFASEEFCRNQHEILQNERVHLQNGLDKFAYLIKPLIVKTC